VTGTAVELATLQWGPSTFIDGEVLAATNANDARMLQWGRRSSSTERVGRNLYVITACYMPAFERVPRSKMTRGDKSDNRAIQLSAHS